MWHESCVFNEYGLSSDERIERLRGEVERVREELSRSERENHRQKRQIDGLRRHPEPRSSRSASNSAIASRSFTRPADRLR